MISELYETRLPMTGPGTILKCVPRAIETQFRIRSASYPKEGLQPIVACHGGWWLDSG